MLILHHHRHQIWMSSALSAIFSFALIVFILSSVASAQQKEAEEQEQINAPETHDPETFFPHPDARYWVSGQANFIFQSNPPFYAAYNGPNSFLNRYQKATSRVLTLFTGLKLNDSIELLFDIEETGGAGLSNALGMAGFVNLDVVRNPTLSKSPYIARGMFHKVFALSKDKVEVDRGPFSGFSQLPARRIEFRFGKFSMADFFDLNTVGTDSHFQFLNWTIDNNGAWDYAADTRGYTVGMILAYEGPSWTFHFAEGLMPTVANGINLQWNLRRAHAENYEFILHRAFLKHKEGAIRFLAYNNTANMGIYRVANQNFLAGVTPTPDITAHPLQSTGKYGFGVNFEQQLNPWIDFYGRFGWNNGKTESYAYTEVDQTVQFGAMFYGGRWKRKFDRAGVAFVSNAIKKDHQKYLALGGLGFLLGDGGLTYGRETIFESYYTAHVWKGFYLGPDVQHVNNPGYNQVRGPVFVGGLRAHFEF
jgi:high affinity Mn2+ porin